MESRLKNMTEGKPLPLIVTFALPLMLGNVFQQLYTIVDTAVVGKHLGVWALAAMGAAEWVSWLLYGVIQGFAQGFGILIAQDYGSGEEARLRRSVGNSVTLSVICAFLFLIIGQAGLLPALRMVGTPEEIIGGTQTYLRIILTGAPIIVSYNLMSCILRALGDGQTPLRAMTLSSVSNIVLDLLFVLGFGWGIAGAAAATMLSQLVAVVYCFIYLRRIPMLHLAKTDYLPEKPLVKKLMGLSLPMAFQNAVIAMGTMVIQTVLNGYGVVFIAGYTATNRLYGLLEIASGSYGYAVLTFVGQNFGAGKLRRIRQGVRTALMVSVATSVAVMLIMLLFGRVILSMFISGAPAEAEAAMDIAWHYLIIMASCLPILYVLHSVRSAIQGMGNTVLPMVSGLAELFMRCATAIGLPLLIGSQTGVLWAEVAAWLGADIILIPSYFIMLRKVAKMPQMHIEEHNS